MTRPARTDGPGAVVHAGRVSDPTVSNADLVELLAAAAAEEADHRKLALERASRAARFWPQEAAELAEAETSLTSLTSVGPWVAAQIHAWLDDPPAVPEPDETRAGYLTLAEVRRTLADDPEWERTPHADLQTHSTDSDGIAGDRRLGRSRPPRRAGRSSRRPTIRRA